MQTAEQAHPYLAIQHWNETLLQEMSNAGTNGRVGERLVSTSDRVNVWLIAMQPGDRLPFHTHVLDYMWCATTAGKARSRYSDGKVVELDYNPGDTKHFHFAQGESMTHDLENIGDTVLCFTTIEFLDSENAPLGTYD